MLRLLPLVFYLLTDQVGRWVRRPSSVLARLAVIAVMCGTAGAILLLFFVAEREVRQRVGNLGANRFVAVETIERTAADEGYPRLDRFIHQLNAGGKTYWLTDAFLPASTELGTRARVMTYAPQAWQAQLAGDTTNAYLLATNAAPTNSLIRCDAGGVTVTAHTFSPPSWLTAIADGQILLVPEHDPWLTERPISTRMTLYEHQGDAEGIREVIAQTRAWLKQQNPRDFRIIHALQVADELANIRAQAFWWRLILLGLFGSAIAIIFGMLAMIEVHDNRDVNLVLRSLGASPWMLFLRQFAEALFVANAALVASLAGVAYGLPLAFQSFGYSAQQINQSTLQQFLRQEGLFIAVFVNLGVLVSLIPAWRSVRGSIGRMLG